MLISLPLLFSFNILPSPGFDTSRNPAISLFDCPMWSKPFKRSHFDIQVHEKDDDSEKEMKDVFNLSGRSLVLSKLAASKRAR